MGRSRAFWGVSVFLSLLPLLVGRDRWRGSCRSPAGISSALDLLPVMISGGGSYPLRVSRPAVAGSGLPSYIMWGRVCCPYQVDGFGGLLRWSCRGVVGGVVAGLRSRGWISPAGYLLPIFCGGSICSEGLRLSYPWRGLCGYLRRGVGGRGGGACADLLRLSLTLSGSLWVGCMLCGGSPLRLSLSPSFYIVYFGRLDLVRLSLSRGRSLRLSAGRILAGVIFYSGLPSVALSVALRGLCGVISCGGRVPDLGTLSAGRRGRGVVAPDLLGGCRRRRSGGVSSRAFGVCIWSGVVDNLGGVGFRSPSYIVGWGGLVLTDIFGGGVVAEVYRMISAV